MSCLLTGHAPVSGELEDDLVLGGVGLDLGLGRQVDIKALLRQRQGSHEDHQQHEQHVDERRDVHVRRHVRLSPTMTSSAPKCLWACFISCLPVCPGLILRLGDQAHVLDLCLAQRVHGHHHAAVGRVFVSLDQDDLGLLAFQLFADAAREVRFRHLDLVEEQLAGGVDRHHRLVLRLGLVDRVDAVGSFTSMPCCSIGAMIIMMMSSTSMTSTSGVTLISDLTPPLPPRFIAIAVISCANPARRRPAKYAGRNAPGRTEVRPSRRGYAVFLMK